MKSLYKLAFLLAISIHSFGQIPAVSDVTPTSGPVGTVVTITGSNFSTTSSDNIVYFGAVKGDVTSASSNELTVIVPPGTTYQPVSVTVNGLTAYSTKIFNTTFPGGGEITPGSFGNVTGYSQTDVKKIAIGDLDGDGRSDVAVTDYGNGKMAIFRNISASNVIAFAPPVFFTIPSVSPHITMGDLDGDGKLDLVVTGDTDQIFLMRNVSTPGTIAFEPGLTLVIATFPNDVSIDDLDGDGKPDLTVATQYKNIHVLRNISTMGSLTAGSFAAPVLLTSGVNTQALSTRDLDGDGKPEIASSSEDEGTISIFRNTSTPGSINLGSFAAKVDFTAGIHPEAMVIADFDGDNKPDIAVSNQVSNSISVFKNVSTQGSITAASFSAKIDFATGTNPSFINAADVDGNGKPDIYVSSSTEISLFRNVSTLGSLTTDSFEPKVDIVNATAGYRPAFMGDLNNDGKPDLAFGGSELYILPNSFNNHFITDFTPVRGDVGTIVTIHGHNFDPIPSNNIVKFNGVEAVVSNGTSTSLEVTVPAGATNGFITVESNGLESQSPSVFIFPPAITSFTPSSGGVGSTVVVNGSNFATLSTNNVVEFNGTPAYVSHSSSNSLSVVVPEGATSGLITVAVNSFTVTSTSDFTIKQNQSITFNDILVNNITMGDLPLSLDATASSGLPIQFSAAAHKVSIVGNQVTLLMPGSVTITASQSGNDQYLAASPVSKTFCINPMKPQVAVENSDIGLPMLVSSSSTGNQWYYNGFGINGATSSSLNVTESGFYNVKVTIDNCVSQISDDTNLTITGIENVYTEKTMVYPSPAQKRIKIELSAFDHSRPIDIIIYNTLSQLMDHTTTDNNQERVELDISKLPNGIYILKADQGKITRQVKFVKED